MVLDYYKLREQPFGVTPDPRYLYASDTHIEALASVLYGVEAGRGFVALIAKPGMGKTTLLFQALTQLRDRATVVFLFQTMLTPEDFLRALLADLGIAGPKGSIIELQSKLNEALAEQSRLGKTLVVVIDEAQNLDDSVLEMVRMLSNFESSQEKLIQFVLSGQPQLADKLASPRLLQLRQRVSIIARLKPFSPRETALYVDHRLRTAGYNGNAQLFTATASAMIAESSEGIPRNINNLCFNALSLGCALKQTTIDRDVMREVIADLDLDPLRDRQTLPRQPAEDGAPSVPSFNLAAASGGSVLSGWLPKFALAGAILLAAGGALLQSHRWTAPKITERQSSIPRTLDASPYSSPTSAERNTPLMPEDGVIQVKPGQTLYRICAQNSGICSPRRLLEIHALNPWLNNFNHIEPGQNIRVPIGSELSETSQKVVGEIGDASPLTGDTQ